MRNITPGSRKASNSGVVWNSTSCSQNERQPVLVGFGVQKGRGTQPGCLIFWAGWTWRSLQTDVSSACWKWCLLLGLWMHQSASRMTWPQRMNSGEFQRVMSAPKRWNRYHYAHHLWGSMGVPPPTGFQGMLCEVVGPVSWALVLMLTAKTSPHQNCHHQWQWHGWPARAPDSLLQEELHITLAGLLPNNEYWEWW